MAIKHTTIKVAGQKLFAVADWNADHSPEQDPVFTAWDKDHADLSNVTANQHHAAATVNALPLTISGQEIKFNYDSNDFQLSGNNLQIKDAGVHHGGLTGLGDDDHTQYLLRQPAADQVINDSGGDFNLRIEGDTEQNLLFIDAGADRVGIGTAVPEERLTVQGSGTTRIMVTDGTTKTKLKAGAAGGYLATSNALPLFLQANDGTGLTLLVNLNVGIGTINPLEKLHVEKAGDVATTGIIRAIMPDLVTDGREVNIALGKSIASAMCALWGYRYDTTSGDEGMYLCMYGDSANSLVIKKGGNVGIGISVPTAGLHLHAGTAAANTAPLKIVAGVVLTNPEAGAIEYDGTHLCYTTTGLTRQIIAYSTSGTYKAIDDYINQHVLTTSVPTFANVTATDLITGRLVIANNFGGFTGSANLTETKTVYSTSTTYVNLDNYINQAVKTTSAVTFNKLTLSSQPKCHIYKSATQTIIDEELTLLSFNSEVYDIGTMHDSAGLNGRITIPAGQGGTYLISALADWDSGDNTRETYIYKNGITILKQASDPPGGSRSQHITTIEELAAGEYVETYVYYSGGDHSIRAGRETTSLIVVKLF